MKLRWYEIVLIAGVLLSAVGVIAILARAL